MMQSSQATTCVISKHNPIVWGAWSAAIMMMVPVVCIISGSLPDDGSKEGLSLNSCICLSEMLLVLDSSTLLGCCAAYGGNSYQHFCLTLEDRTDSLS